MKIYNLKKASIPKVAVLATGLVGAVLVASIGPPAAQAFPSRARDCAGCHIAGGSTTATPSTLTPAAGAAYSVAITLAANPAGGLSGYAIVPVTAGTGAANGGNSSSALSYSAAMTAPAAAGTYTYNVFTNMGLTDPDGQASSASYSITVAAAPTTVPPTTVPPTTVPPTTVPPTTVPPTTVPPTTVPPTTVPPTTVPPTTVPPTTVPPTTVPPTTVPPTTVPPTTVPPTTVPPTTVPPTTVPPTTVPPTTVPPTTVPPVQTAPSVRITAIPPALTTMNSAAFSFVGADSTDPVGSLTYLCSLDGAVASPCTSPKLYVGLTSALHRFTVTARDPSSNSGSASYAWRVDRVAPTLSMTAPVAPYSLATSLVSSWSARDVGVGVANVDARWTRASFSTGFSAAFYPSTWQRTRAGRATLAGVAPGYTYCFSARARDTAGNLSPWSAPRCSAVALDDRSLTATAGWSRARSSAFYRGTATTTTRSGVVLTRTGVQAKRIYLVASRGPNNGTVGVYWNGVLVKKVSLAAARTTRRNVIAVASFTSVRSGKLTIRTLVNRKTVQIDGVSLVRG
jgi:hypothetical protein